MFALLSSFIYKSILFLGTDEFLNLKAGPLIRTCLSLISSSIGKLFVPQLNVLAVLCIARLAHCMGCLKAVGTISETASRKKDLNAALRYLRHCPSLA